MKILFFDTETTGLPANWRAPMSDVNNWPRVIQLGWILTDREGSILRRQKHLIKPDGWVVPKEKFWIENGYSTEHNNREGIPVRSAIELFDFDLKDSILIVSHNMSYDYNVLGAEMLRTTGICQLVGKQQVCTKLASTSYCRIPQASGRGLKWPTLTELHTHLFGTGFEGAHDALADVLACKNSFFELVKRGVIKLNEPSAN